MMATPKRDTFTVPELQESLEALSVADRIRLEKKARFYCGSTGMEWEDLLNEAICRSLEDGGRSCPRDVALTVFLGNVMRSIADEERKQWSREELEGASNEKGCLIANTADPNPSPEHRIADRINFDQIMNKIEAMFADNPQALAIVMGDAVGWSPSEICELEPMNSKEFATARRRVRRALQREFPKGYEK